MAGGQAAVDRTALWPYAGIPYSMSGTNTPTGHRQDCSGFVSMCWDMPTPGEDTQSFVTEGWMTEIYREELQPGDAIGMCGWGTLGAAGHIQLVEAYDPWTGLITYWEQNGGEAGPHRRHNTYMRGDYHAYRYTGTVGIAIEEDDMEPHEAQELALIDIMSRNALVYGATTLGPNVGNPNWLDPNTPMWIVVQINNITAALRRIEMVLDQVQPDGSVLVEHTHEAGGVVRPPSGEPPQGEPQSTDPLCRLGRCGHRRCRTRRSYW
jgi:hypothetical protein